MPDSKYVIGDVQVGMLEVTVAIVIPYSIPHESIKDVFVLGSILSAGFFTIHESHVVAHGKSVGLGVDALIHDDLLIGRTINHPAYK